MPPTGATDLAMRLGAANLPVRSFVRPAVRLRPQSVDDRHLLLEHVVALTDGWERDAQLRVLVLVPAGTEAGLDAPAAHLVDGLDHLGEVAGKAEGDGRDEDAQADRARLPRQTGQRGPCVGGGQ